MERSTSICDTGLVKRPFLHCASYSFSVEAVDPPAPPRVKAGRMMAGRPTVLKCGHSLVHVMGKGGFRNF